MNVKLGKKLKEFNYLRDTWFRSLVICVFFAYFISILVCMIIKQPNLPTILIGGIMCIMILMIGLSFIWPSKIILYEQGIIVNKTVLKLFEIDRIDYRCNHGNKGKSYNFNILTRKGRSYSPNISKKCKKYLEEYCKEHRIPGKFDK